MKYISYSSSKEKKVMLKIAKVTTYLVFIALLLVGSGCKKESNNGVSGAPVVTGFPGCQLLYYGDYMIRYNANGTIHSIGPSTYTYIGNKVLIEIDGGENFALVLNSEKNPVSGVYLSGGDSTLFTYTYDVQGYLQQIEVTEMMDGLPSDKTQLQYEYQNGNRTRTTLSINGEVLSKISYEYDLTKLDARKDFYERVFINFDDLVSDFPLYGGKWSKNMLTTVTMEEDGDTYAFDLINEYDETGKVINTILEKDGSPSGQIFYDYLCK